MNITEEEYNMVMRGLETHTSLLVKKISELNLTIATKSEILRLRDEDISKFKSELNNAHAETALVYKNCVTFCPRCGQIVVYRDKVWKHVNKDGKEFDDITLGHSLVAISNGDIKVKKRKRNKC